MAEDWRITIDFDDEENGTQLVEWLAARRFESEERDSFGGRVAVSRDGPVVFLYADTEDLARDADGIVRALLSSEGLQAQVAFERWHPVEQEWKDAALPLPRTEEELEKSRASLWGRVVDPAGRSLEATLETPGGYRLTVLCALAVVERVLDGLAPPGFSTPSRAFTKDLITAMQRHGKADASRAPALVLFGNLVSRD